jgi:uracil phosphoribosyltransferase
MFLGKLHVSDHPLILHKLSLLRDRTTGTKQFRELLREVATLLTYELTRDLPLRETRIQTPVAEAKAHRLAGKKMAVIPVLRAGLGMADGILAVLPAAKVGHIGLYRDESTLRPVEYYCKLPADCGQRMCVIVDPMLATGHSASAGIRLVKKGGAAAIRLMGLVAAPEGIDRVHSDHPDVDIFVAAVDETLNAQGYIVPGLGDAGDRLFGTD